MFNKGSLLFDFMNAKESVQGDGKQSSAKLVFEVLRSLSYYLNVTDPLIIPVLFVFYLVVKRLMITKNSFVKIQSLIVNHELGPVKLNPA